MPSEMIAHPLERENRNDDLDLLVLLKRIVSFAKRYGRLILVCAFAGMMAGALLYAMSPKRYSSSLLLHSFMLTNTEHINIIENWNELLKKGEFTALGKELNCDAAMLKEVSNISASEIQKLYSPNNPNGFMVEVLVSDTAVLDPLQSAIVYGLGNGSYIKEKLDSRRSNLEQLVGKVNTEITKLDSVKHDIENSINRKTTNSSSFIIDISNITGQMMSLNEKLVGYKEDLKFTQSVQVLHNFAKFSNPVSPKLGKLLALGFIGGFAVGYLVSVCMYLKRRLSPLAPLHLIN